MWHPYPALARCNRGREALRLRHSASGRVRLQITFAEFLVGLDEIAAKKVGQPSVRLERERIAA